jgi:hypothetical protein
LEQRPQSYCRVSGTNPATHLRRISRDPGSRHTRVICLYRWPKPGLCNFDHARTRATFGPAIRCTCHKLDFGGRFVFAAPELSGSSLLAPGSERLPGSQRSAHALTPSTCLGLGPLCVRLNRNALQTNASFQYQATIIRRAPAPKKCNGEVP